MSDQPRPPRPHFWADQPITAAALNQLVRYVEHLVREAESAREAAAGAATDAEATRRAIDFTLGSRRSDQ